MYRCHTVQKSRRIRQLQVDRGFNASDHNTITFNIGLDDVTDKLIRPWHNAKWELFTDELLTDWDLPERMTKKKLDKMVDYFYSRVNRALVKACKMVKVTRSSRKRDWFSDKLLLFKEKLHKQYKRHVRFNNDSETLKYHNLKRALQTGKKEILAKLCNFRSK